MPSRLPFAFVLAMAAACGHGEPGDDPRAKDSPLLTSKRENARPIDLARAAKDPEELVRALAAPRGQVLATLGPHKLHGTGKLRVTENGQEIEALDEDTTIEQAGTAGTGDFHAVYTNSKDYGREVFYVGAGAAGAGGFLWLRPRYGKFHHRAPTTPDEPAQIADDIAGTLGADLDLLAPGLVPTDAGATQTAGRPARKVTLAAGKGAVRKHAAPEQAWRDTIVVQSIAGELVLDAQTGAVLAGHVDGTLTFVREGHSYAMSLSATVEMTEVGVARTITPPPADESVETPTRSHEVEERDELLQGIAPPARRGPAPKGTRPAAP